jgi:shikimate dehydrogenase
MDARYINCEVEPAALGDAARGARAMGWRGFNCSIPHKVAIIQHLDGLGQSAATIGAVNCAVRRGDKLIGENTDGVGFMESLRTAVDPAGKSLNEKTKAKASFVLWDQTYAIDPAADILVNATSIGLFPDVEGRLDIDMSTVRPGVIVADVIPNPPRTALVREAEARGARTLDGLGMLVNQGVVSIRHWFGVDVDPGVMRRKVEDLFGA